MFAVISAAFSGAGLTSMRNLEAKFRVRDHAAAHAAAEALGYIPQGLLLQHYTFFRVPNGKLKLRDEGNRAYMIGYGRGGYAELQLSEYHLVPVADAALMHAMLRDALGVLAEVRKRRTLLLHGHVRLHLDEVEGLGNFGELEAVLADDADLVAERAFLAKTLTALGIADDELIEGSYFQMMAPQAPSAAD